MTLDYRESHAEPSWIDDFNQRVCQVALSRIEAEFDPLVWQAFDLTWCKEEEPKQVAAALQKSAAWVYKAKFKVIQRLKQEIEFLTDDVAYFAKE